MSQKTACSHFLDKSTPQPPQPHLINDELAEWVQVEWSRLTILCIETGVSLNFFSKALVFQDQDLIPSLSRIWTDSVECMRCRLLWSMIPRICLSVVQLRCANTAEMLSVLSGVETLGGRAKQHCLQTEVPISVTASMRPSPNYTDHLFCLMQTRGPIFKTS